MALRYKDITEYLTQESLQIVDDLTPRSCSLLELWEHLTRQRTFAREHLTRPINICKPFRTKEQVEID
jgi:hypothetical protein